MRMNIQVNGAKKKPYYLNFVYHPSATSTIDPIAISLYPDSINAQVSPRKLVSRLSVYMLMRVCSMGRLNPALSLLPLSQYLRAIRTRPRDIPPLVARNRGLYRHYEHDSVV